MSDRRTSAVPSWPVLLVALVAAFACRPSAAEVAVGQAAPDFALTDLDGRQVKLADLRGKLVVLEWMNPNCPFSRGHAESKTMVATAARHPDVVWLGINSTRAGHGDFVAPADYKTYDARHGIAYPVLYDTSGAVGHAYGARTTPHMFVVDREGKIAYQGAIDDGPSGATTNYVDQALTALEAGKRPDPSTTKPYGCSVKY
jgi:peroxiredoxin